MTILEFAHNGQPHRFVVEAMTEDEKQLFRTAKPHLFDTVFNPARSDDTVAEDQSTTPSPSIEGKDVDQKTE